MRAVISVPGLPQPRGASPAARRRALAKSSDRAIAGQLVDLARAIAASGAPLEAPIGAAAGLPLGEVLASPFALRIVAMAVAQGASTTHGDLRAVLTWPSAHVGERGTQDDEHGVWDRGVLRLGKYQQFLDDEPFATFHADHTSKWGPHELMHRVVGFFHRPGCSRWELYLGARLNELLPVVSWYGLEQAMRLEEDAFDRRRAGAHLSAKVSEARWLEESPKALRERALRGVPRLRETIEHFERELAAIDAEIATGDRVRVPHPFLDSSSDAVAYVAGHRPRLEQTGDVIAALVPRGVVRFEHIGEYRIWIEQVFDALLFADVEVDLELAAKRRVARCLWDFVQRAAQLGGRPLKAARNFAADAGRDIARGLGGEAIDLAGWRSKLERALGASARHVIENGDRVHGAMAIGQLADGVRSCAPRTLEELGDHGTEVLTHFAVDDTILERAPLANRLAHYLDEHRDDPHASLAHFEAAIASARTRDDRIERICERGPLPDSLDDAMIVRSEAFVRIELDVDAAAVHAGASPRRGKHAFLIGAHGEEVAVVDAPEQVARALELLRERPRPAREIAKLLDRIARLPGWPKTGRAWLDELIAAGALGWIRPVKSH